MSLGLYLHFPFCRRRCRYCAFVSGTDFTIVENYLARLLAELKARKVDDEVGTIYFGGGTPSAVPAMIGAAAAAIRQNYQLKREVEFTAECNPESVTPAFIAALREAGVNRVSIGLQAAQDGLLRLAGRPHTYRDFLTAYERIRAANIENVNVDVILGLPGQTVGDVVATVEALLKLNVQHMSVYALKTEAGTPLYKDGYFPDEDLQAEMYSKAFSLLKGEYRRYEVSNFAKPGCECRHNLGCWQLEEYLGFGAAAHSYYHGYRSYNCANVAAYIAGQAPLSEDVAMDYAEEYIMLSLRTDRGCDLEKLKAHGCDLLALKARQIDKHRRRGNLTITGGRLKLTEDAFYIMNSVIVDLI